MKVIHDHLSFLHRLMLSWLFRLVQEDVVEGGKRNRKEKNGKRPLFLAGCLEGRAEEGSQFVCCWKPPPIQGTLSQRTNYPPSPDLSFASSDTSNWTTSCFCGYPTTTVSASEGKVLYCTTLVGETAPTKQGPQWRGRGGGSVSIH